MCNLPANVMCTSTVTGTVVVSGYVWDADKVLGRSNAFSVLLNGRAEPDPAGMAERYGAETTLPDWGKRLVCGQCGSRNVSFVVSGA